MCVACDMAEHITEEGKCPCGGELKYTGEVITTSPGREVFLCQDCKLYYHILDDMDEDNRGFVPQIKGRLSRFPNLAKKVEY